VLELTVLVAALPGILVTAVTVQAAALLKLVLAAAAVVARLEQ
jgi:hypothetical protein